MLQTVVKGLKELKWQVYNIDRNNIDYYTHNLAIRLFVFK